MMEFRARQLSVAGVGVISLVAALLLWGSDLFNIRENIRELTFDQALGLLAARPQSSSVIVVDIDSEKSRTPWTVAVGSAGYCRSVEKNRAVQAAGHRPRHTAFGTGSSFANRTYAQSGRRY